MLFLRKLGPLLLGKASRFQILVASTVGAMLGFVPGFFLLGFGRGLSDAPALVFSLLAIVLILNTNLAVFGLSFVLAKLAAVPLLPLSFEVGSILLDGPTQGLFRWLINAPFFAWFGLERYATTGGLALGFVVGLVFGILFWTGLRKLQTRMADVEDGERYQQWTGKFWVRALSWLFLGARPKPGIWEAKLEAQKRVSPIRWLGLAAAVLFGLGLYLAQSFFAGPALRHLAREGLESWNGATVDLARAEVDLAGARMSLAGLALADPEALETDSFRARSLELSVGTTALLSRRFVIDEIHSKEASSGLQREQKGERIRKESEAPPAPPAEPGDKASKTLEDYVKDAQKWHARLQRVSEILARLQGSSEAGSDGTTEEDKRRAEDAAREQARLLGLARARAEHLVRGAPRVLVRKLAFEGLRVAGFEELFDVSAKNVSTAPSLVDDPLSVELRSRSGSMLFQFGADASKNESASTNFVWKGIPIDTIAGELLGLPLRGGSVDLSLRGDLDFSKKGGAWIDLPLRVTLRDTTLALQGVQETALDQVEIPLGLRGPLGSPRITVETKAFVDALITSGRAELAKQVGAKLESLLGDQVPGLGGTVQDVLGGKKSAAQVAEEAKRRAVEEAKKRAAPLVDDATKRAKKRALKELEKVLPGGLPKGLPKLPGGLFGGKKDPPKQDAGKQDGSKNDE